MPVFPATAQDIPSLVALMNSAYRGEGSKKGWTTEADLLDGDLRTDEVSLNKLINEPGVIFLKHVNENNIIEGCVFLQVKEDQLYLGMLSVSPEIQAKGIGKQLMTAATMYARDKKCTSIFMKVISVRDELIAWYERQGYRKTGATEPFPSDNRFGIPTRPLKFVIMEKMI
jgi:ribosomal protein S18 acetylase RimI-like enzyme